MESEMNAAPSEQGQVEVEYSYRVQGPGHSLLDVLMPANPPEPKNARVIRLFDIEGAKNEQPQGFQPAPARREARSGRRASRELRNQSLLAAAGNF
jgi:hypothetical protein